MKRSQVRRVRAVGQAAPDGRSRSIAVHFESEIFDAIAEQALKKGIPFGEQVRIYVGRGMDLSENEITRRAATAERGV